MRLVSDSTVLNGILSGHTRASEFLLLPAHNPMRAPLTSAMITREGPVAVVWNELIRTNSMAGRMLTAPGHKTIGALEVVAKLTVVVWPLTAMTNAVHLKGGRSQHISQGTTLGLLSAQRD